MKTHTYVAAYILCAAILLVTYAEGEAVGGHKKVDHKQFYRHYSPDSRSRANGFVTETSAAIHRFLVYAGVLDGMETKHPLGTLHQEMWKSFGSVVAADRRGRNPQASQGAAYQVAANGAVSFGGGMGGMKEHQNAEDAKAERAQQKLAAKMGVPIDASAAYFNDPVDAATKGLVNALNNHVLQRDIMIDGRRTLLVPGARQGEQEMEEGGLLETDDASFAPEQQDHGVVGTGSIARYTTRMSAQKKAGVPHAEHGLPDGLVEHTTRYARAMAAQQTPTDASSLYTNVAASFCTLGAVAVGNSTLFDCTSTGWPSNLTAVEFAALPVGEQAACTIPAGTSVECVCPFDYTLGTTALGQQDCYLKRIDCSTQITSPVQDCPVVSVDDNFISPKCFSIAQGATTLTLESNTTCGLIYTPPRSYEVFGVEVTFISSATLDTIFVTLPHRYYLSTTNNQARAVVAPYRSLDSLAFTYLVDMYLSGERLAVSITNSIVSSGGFFAQIYNFRRISDTTHYQQVAVSAATSTQLTGGEMTSYTFDITNMNTEFIAGGRLYVEAGFAGGISSNAAVTADAMAIDIDGFEPPEPAASIDGGLRTALIILAVVVGVLLLLALITGFRSWRQGQQKKSEFDEDNE